MSEMVAAGVEVEVGVVAVVVAQSEDVVISG